MNPLSDLFEVLVGFGTRYGLAHLCVTRTHIQPWEILASIAKGPVPPKLISDHRDEETGLRLPI